MVAQLLRQGAQSTQIVAAQKCKANSGRGARPTWYPLLPEKQTTLGNTFEHQTLRTGSLRAQHVAGWESHGLTHVLWVGSCSSAIQIPQIVSVS